MCFCTFVKTIVYESEIAAGRKEEVYVNQSAC